MDNLLQNDPSLVQSIATQLLEVHFPDTMRDDILEEVGLLHNSVYKKRARDPLFRKKILRAYEYSCAVCGFNVRLGKNLIAIEAAHIQWHQAGNGIALCSLHHKLFDRGVFTISQESELRVSEEAYGTNGFEEWLLRFHGHRLRAPIHPAYLPKDLYIYWHVREVFRGNTRYVSS